MRVAIFTDNDFDKVNGVTTTLSAVLQYAPPSLTLRIYTADDVGVDRPQYLALRSIGIPIPYYGEMKMYLPRVREYIRRVRADGMNLIHLTTPGPVGLAAMRVARALRLPMVGTFHTDLAAYTTVLSGRPALGALMREYMRWPYGRCDRILVPSDATRRLLAGANGDPRRIDVLTRGVDTLAFSPARRSASLRQQWQVSSARPAILYVGRISREKGLDLLPALERQLQELEVPHRFVIAGQGPLLAELRAQLRDAVFTGMLNRGDVAVAFASADVFVFPSRTDTAGNVVLEAQASGLPVLVADAGGPQENMLRDRTGFVVSGTQAQSWAEAVAPVVRDAALRARLGTAARQYAFSRRWETALAPLYRTYDEVLLARPEAVTQVLAVAQGRAS